MDDLEELYDSIKMLEELGIPVSKEVIQQMWKAESKYVKDILADQISTTLSPILEQLKNPATLYVKYIPNERPIVEPIHAKAEKQLAKYLEQKGVSKSYMHLNNFCYYLLTGTKNFLSEREYSILQYLLKGMSLVEVGAMYQLTGERVRQLAIKTMRRIAKVSEKMYFKIPEIERENLMLKNELAHYKQLVKSLKENRTEEDNHDNGAGESSDNDIDDCLYPSLLMMPVHCLNLSVRSMNAIKSAGVLYLYQLAQYSISDILKWRNCGKKTLNEITDMLEYINLESGLNYKEILTRINKLNPSLIDNFYAKYYVGESIKWSDNEGNEHLVETKEPSKTYNYYQNRFNAESDNNDGGDEVDQDIPELSNSNIEQEERNSVKTVSDEQTSISSSYNSTSKTTLTKSYTSADDFYEKIWTQFISERNENPDVNFKDYCSKKKTYYQGIISWIRRNGYAIPKATKKNVDYSITDKLESRVELTTPDIIDSDIELVVINSDSNQEKRKMLIINQLIKYKIPMRPKEIAGRISISEWGGSVSSFTVDSMLKLMPEVEYVEYGKYALKKTFLEEESRQSVLIKEKEISNHESYLPLAKQGSKWTQEDCDLLVAMYFSGKPWGEIVSRMQRSFTAVASRVALLVVIPDQKLNFFYCVRHHFYELIDGKIMQVIATDDLKLFLDEPENFNLLAKDPDFAPSRLDPEDYIEVIEDRR